MKKRSVLISALCLTLFAILFIVSCASPLPRGQDTIKSQWNSFDEAKGAFDQITVDKTTTFELQQLGFNPYSTPNVSILSYLDIYKKFTPNSVIKDTDLPPSVLACLATREECIAYEATPGFNKSERVGSVVLDLLNFKRKSLISGWQFNALIVISNDIVVYKIWSGQPNINKEVTRDNPLGPLQESVGSTLKNTVTK